MCWWCDICTSPSSSSSRFLLDVVDVVAAAACVDAGAGASGEEVILAAAVVVVATLAGDGAGEGRGSNGRGAIAAATAAAASVAGVDGGGSVESVMGRQLVVGVRKERKVGWQARDRQIRQSGETRFDAVQYGRYYKWYVGEAVFETKKKKERKSRK